MRITRFSYKGKISWGVIEKEQIILLKAPPFEKISLSKEKLKLDKAQLLAPVLPSKVILTGLNYKEHAKELKVKIPDAPTIFLKPPTSITGPNTPIIYPEGIKRLDYEAELAVVIRKLAKNIEEDEVPEYILGYTCLNDITARDIQKKEVQWTRAKSFDTFCPIGPWIETTLDPANTTVRCYLNNVLKQSAKTTELIFSVEKLISFISKTMTLLPGDIISTGTPKGIGPMLPGDTVKVAIDGIGVLENYITTKNASTPYIPQ